MAKKAMRKPRDREVPRDFASYEGASPMALNKGGAFPYRRAAVWTPHEAPRQPDSSAAWMQLTDQLDTALGALEEDEYLVLQLKGTNRFVQFAMQGSFGMRIEAVSNFYLPEDQQLDDDDHETLLRLGWCAATNLPEEIGGHHPDGSPNYFLDLAPPVPLRAVAELAVATLFAVYGAEHPLDLEYSAFGESVASIRLPNLGLRRATAPQ
jgi:hypothetical protein